MKWQPWYTIVIIAIITTIVKSFQKNTKKIMKIKNIEKDVDEMKNSGLDENSQNVSSPTLQASAFNSIIKLIEEMGYILISKKISNTLDYEITFVNYKKKFFELKRQPTYIKINGNDKSNEVSYTTWSENYEYGQNSHNENIAQSFFKKLSERDY